ncbi:MAG: hypothetical protein AAB396_02675 [Patescibacteria group bacterium]
MKSHIENLNLNKLDQEYHLENIKLLIESRKNERLNEKDFRDVFDEKEIEDDLKIVNILENRFGKDINHLNQEEIIRIENSKKRSEALEIIIINEGEINNWFGENAYLVRTTKFDDFINGFDGILEIDSQGTSINKIQRAALAIDASMKTDYYYIKSKIDRNIEKITTKEGQSGIKYFKSAIDDYKGKLENIIPIVIGVKGETVDELIDFCAQLIKLKSNKEKTDNEKTIFKEIQKKIEEHPAQFIFLEEIKMQLNMYSRLLENKNDEISNLYKQEIKDFVEIINNIIESKKDIIQNKNEIENDEIYLIIKNLTK